MEPHSGLWTRRNIRIAHGTCSRPERNVRAMAAVDSWGLRLLLDLSSRVIVGYSFTPETNGSR